MAGSYNHDIKSFAKVQVNYNINKVLKNFYKALEKIRYPEIPQHDFNHFQTTILAKDNRSSLLHWLLMEFLMITNSVEDPPAVNDDDAIVRWYKSMCLCNREDALLGKCPIEAQLPTLVNLTHLIDIILDYTTNKPEATDGDEMWSILSKWTEEKVNIIPPFVILPSELTHRKSMQYVETVKNHLKDSENNLRNKAEAEKSLEATDNPSDLAITPNVTTNDIWTIQPVSEFLETFQSHNFMITTKNPSTPQSMDKSVQAIHSKFVPSNEAVSSKMELSSIKIPETLNVATSELETIIDDTVIAVENLVRYT